MAYCLVIGCRSSFSNEFKDEDSDLNDSIFVRIEPSKGIFYRNGTDKKGYKFGLTNVVVQTNKTQSINWIILKNKSHKCVVSIPEKWIVKRRDKTFLFVKPDVKTDDFFVWKRYAKSNSNLENFANHYYSVLSSDTVEVFSNPSISKQMLKNSKFAYRLSGVLSTNKHESVFYSLLTEDEHFFHELTIKISSLENTQLYKLIFDLMLESTFISDHAILKSDGYKFKSLTIDLNKNNQ